MLIRNSHDEILILIPHFITYEFESSIQFHD